MKINLIITLVFAGLLAQISCSTEDNEKQIIIPDVTDDIEIQDFIWQGLNIFYLWQENVSNLADDKITNQTDYVNFLKATPNPEDFFENLIFDRNNTDKWSWIVDDYIKQEQEFEGTSLHNGVDFSLISVGNSDNIIGYVRYILPNSDASDKEIKRGDIITHVNDTKLTFLNYRDLLFDPINTSYTLSLAKIENNTIVSTGVNVSLTKFEYTENPVFIVKNIDQSGHKIGYLFYNWFTANFDNELNDAFLQFKNEGITDLIVDLRYNPGGFVSSASALSSMITGQFKDEIFSKEEWNSKFQQEFENSAPERLINTFSDRLANGNIIHSLGLSKVHIIVSGRSASASELVISSLMPYINVRLIGTRTVGKYVASTTIYDSQNFSKNGVNSNHTYAMQPIIFKTVNKDGASAKGGFQPHIDQKEDIANMGVLGDPTEPLLNSAINDIIGVTSKTTAPKSFNYQSITNTKLQGILKDNMFAERDNIMDLIKNKRRNSK